MQIKRINWSVSPVLWLFGWRVKRGGMTQNWYRLKEDAVDAAVDSCNRELRRFGQTSELTIRLRNGRISDKRTYGDDPEGSKG